LGILIPEPIDRRALAWSFVPGLGHLKTGRPAWGRVLLPAWVVFLMLTILTVGTHWSRYMLAGMIAVHALALVTLFAANLAWERLIVRALFGMVVFLTLNFLVYEPGVWFSSRFLVAVPIARSPEGGAVARGDGLLCEGPWIRPDAYQRGDVVLYAINDISFRELVIRGGHGVNRVVGIPGDRVVRHDGTLTVNGEAPVAEFAPLGRIPAIGDLDVTLGPSEYAVFTNVERVGLIPLRHGRLAADTLTRHLSVVNYYDIRGRVLLRIRPFSRLGRIG